MKVHLSAAIFLTVLLVEYISYTSGDEQSDDVTKRRGWGKRDSEGEQDYEKRRGWGKRSMDEPEDALADDVSQDVTKRRGWGKRAMDKRRGWGKRSDATDMESLREALEYSKRRGWGKRSSAETAVESSMLDKRRGWGKRSEGSIIEEAKRRGWGKRSDVLEDVLDNNDVDKRRGWGKRGWGKRSPARSCEALQEEVMHYVELAVEVSFRNTVTQYILAEYLNLHHTLLFM